MCQTCERWGSSFPRVEVRIGGPLGDVDTHGGRLGETPTFRTMTRSFVLMAYWLVKSGASWRQWSQPRRSGGRCSTGPRTNGTLVAQREYENGHGLRAVWRELPEDASIEVPLSRVQRDDRVSSPDARCLGQRKRRPMGLGATEQRYHQAQNSSETPARGNRL